MSYLFDMVDYTHAASEALKAHNDRLAVVIYEIYIVWISREIDEKRGGWNPDDYLYLFKKD